MIIDYILIDPSLHTHTHTHTTPSMRTEKLDHRWIQGSLPLKTKIFVFYWSVKSGSIYTDKRGT
jgi:hypothetical protein